MTGEEQALFDAWRAAERVWKADPLNREKEQAVERASWALNVWRRTNTPEGIAYANAPKTFRDETGDNDPEGCS